ncbi:MAG: hypothetical protein Q4G69_06235 [Planctomycetia bacterium]|nr:hypothetical protein [Planctomycetia bacterium]
MLENIKKFNVCELCGGHLRVVKSSRFETCRLRTYCCDKCRNLKKSREKFQDKESQNPYELPNCSDRTGIWEGVIDED